MGDSGASGLRRRHIDSGISVGRESNGAEDGLENSEEDDVVFKDVVSSTEPVEDTESKPADSRINAIKERLMSTVNQFAFGAKYFGLAFLVWIVGYMGFSFLWLAIVVFVYTWRLHRQKRKKSVTEVLNNIAEDEKKYFQTVKDIYKLSDKELPSWVYFPDIEKAEWLNRVLGQLWPYVSDFVKQTILEKIEPAICQSNVLLKGFSFSKVELGEKSPRVAGVKVYGDGQTRRTEIVMDLQLIYQSDTNIRVSINGLSAGIKNLSLRGLVRVELRPLISSIPLAGAVSVSFVHQPTIDFDLTDLGNLFDLPGVDLLLRSAVSDVVDSMMVLPERYVLKLVEDVDVSLLMHPLPKGVVRIHILEAKNLEEKDRKFLGVGGGSDPYVKIKVGREHEFKTKTVDHNVNPVWNESFDAPVMEVHTSSIEITLYDDDGALSTADYLGSASINMTSVYNEGVVDEWIQLSNVKHGAIHVKIEWLELSDDPNKLREVMEHGGKHNLNSALLSVYIDSAKDLPSFIDGKYEPSPYVKIEVSGRTKTFKTKVVPNTNNPVWEENFRALIQNPRMDSLNIKVQDSEDVLGTLKVKINELVTAPNMVKDRPFNLTNSGYNSRIQMRLTARLLIPRNSRNNKRLKGSKSSFVVAATSKTTKKPPVLNNTDASSKTESSNEKHDPLNDTTNSNTDANMPSHDSDTVSLTSADTGLNFARSPARSNGSEPSNSESFISETSSIADDKSLRMRITGNNNNDSPGYECPLGRLNLTLSYSQQKQKLYLEILKAEKLIVCDEDNNTSDPYVKVYMLPDQKINRRSSQRRKTKVVKNSVNPKFNEMMEWDVMKGDLYHCQLDIIVKNKTGLLSSEKVRMGHVLINLAGYNWEHPNNEWHALQNISDDSD